MAEAAPFFAAGMLAMGIFPSARIAAARGGCGPCAAAAAAVAAAVAATVAATAASDGAGGSTSDAFGNHGLP